MPCGAPAILLLASAAVHAAVPPARTVRHDDHVIQRALDFVAQPLNPILLVSIDRARAIVAATPGGGVLSPRVNAFRAPGAHAAPHIYVIRESAVYRRAARAETLGLLKLAATLVHEQVHATDGDAAAYRLQADFVRTRLHTAPIAQREAGRRYLEALDARAAGLARERLVHSRR